MENSGSLLGKNSDHNAAKKTEIWEPISKFCCVTLISLQLLVETSGKLSPDNVKIWICNSKALFGFVCHIQIHFDVC